MYRSPKGVHHRKILLLLQIALPQISTMTLSSHLWCFVRKPCFYKLQEAFKIPAASVDCDEKKIALVAHLGLLLRGLLLGSFVHLLVLLKDLLHRHFLVNLMVVTGVARVLHHDLVELLGAEL